jgi:glucose/arabinose dehydrogenase
MLALALLFSAGTALGQGSTATLVHDNVNFPGTIRFAPDGRLFVLETFSGRVIVYADTAAVTPTVWATIPVINTSEHGLLGLAFHPQFPDSPFVYLYHTNPDPYFNRIVRMRDSAGVGTNYIVLLDSLSTLSESHEGGRLAFGPDHFLYATCGDQGLPYQSQDVTVPYGKILRLTTTGKAAPGNPFGPNNPVVVYGLRNSYGLCFDPLTGQGYFTDNGPTCDDELNYFQFAANYGWGPNDPCGSQPPGTKLPMWTITPTIAPTGVCVYRGDLLKPYDGNVFFCGYNDGDLRRVILQPGHPDSANSVNLLFNFGVNLLDVTEGPDQFLWVSNASQIWRIGPPPVGVDDHGPIAASWMPGPSPFTNRVALAARGGVELRRIDVLDVSGRRVRSFPGPISASLIWNGDDQYGRAVPAGVYLVRGETAAGMVMRRVVRLAR